MQTTKIPSAEETYRHRGMNNQNALNSLDRKSSTENTLLNIILIILNAFRYDLFMENLDALSNLQALSSQNVFFENAFSVSPLTPFAFPGIVAGVYPYHFETGIPNEVKAIDELLKYCEYNTEMINESNAFLISDIGYSTH